MFSKQCLRKSEKSSRKKGKLGRAVELLESSSGQARLHLKSQQEGFTVKSQTLLKMFFNRKTKSSPNVGSDKVASIKLVVASKMSLSPTQ